MKLYNLYNYVIGKDVSNVYEDYQNTINNHNLF